MEFVEFKINGMVGMEWNTTKNGMEFISFFHDQICYGMILFVFSLFIFGIDGMSIPFHSCQMVNFFMELME